MAIVIAPKKTVSRASTNASFRVADAEVSVLVVCCSSLTSCSVPMLRS
jgi:hypothetical protein